LQDRRLYWVGRNRTRPDRTRNAGKLLADFARSVEGPGADLATAAAAISPVVDDDFRQHATVAAVGGGVLTVHVSEPGLVAGVRLQWSKALLAALQQERAFASIRRVVFEYGAGGTRLRNQA
jgi:hypothetical protein